MPEDDPAYSPPPGLKQPRRGFGLVWRTTEGLADRIGWAVNDEVPFNLIYQETPGDTPRFFFSDYLGQAIALEPEGKGWLVIGTMTVLLQPTPARSSSTALIIPPKPSPVRPLFTTFQLPLRPMAG